MIGKLITLIYLLSLPDIIMAQIPFEDMNKYLTNGSRRVWIFKDYRTNFGSCSGTGQSFEFSNTGQLAWKKCNNGELAYKSLGWKITPVSGRVGEYVITFSQSIEIEKGIRINSAQIHFVSPRLNSRNIKMFWNIPDCQKCLEPVFELHSKN